MNLEDLCDQLSHKHDIAIFCSFLMDNFDGEVHARMLPRLGVNHSHLVPVEDYARLERAVALSVKLPPRPAPCWTPITSRQG
jgi:hypothetical protein